MNTIARRIVNLFLYGRWTTCRHENVRPVGFADWKCDGCGWES